MSMINTVQVAPLRRRQLSKRFEPQAQGSSVWTAVATGVLLLVGTVAVFLLSR